ncbi:MAG: hypothetical protein QOK29_949 [Rhodospirillaceae bacterium]|jgi:hypothetical protein|nr:hypothetical protein [Rhodospirillaceae bacterium]
MQVLLRVFDQLNPFSLGNIIVYFTWLVVYSFTLVAVWRSPKAWVRLCCLLVNQLFSVGVLISWSLTILLAYTYLLQSAIVCIVVAGTTFYLFRER